MTTDEFISAMTSRGAVTYPALAPRSLELANISLQSRRCAVIPYVMRELYSKIGAMHLGSGYIFGPTAVARPGSYPIPGLVQINDELTHPDNTRGQTIFGRNDLFFFAFDAFGTFYMLENITLRVLKQYDDPYRAMTDCLMGGKLL